MGCNTQEPVCDWKDEWLVIGDEGADPFIFERSEGKIMFAYHGAGLWEPKDLFSDVCTMVTCLHILSSIVMDAGGDLTDDQSIIKEIYVETAATKLDPVLHSPTHTKLLLGEFGWANS